MSGGSLGFHLNKIGKFEENHVKFFSSQIVSALSFLNEKNFLNF
jgi:serine/threonine protein kinase